MDPFEEFRPLLFSIAYEITSSATDADDVLQEAYLRWAQIDQATVENPRAYLAQTVSRQALNHLRTRKRRREEYVGNWLPEPILTSPDASTDVVLAESVSMAMLLVLETLGPTERAVFVLREAFGFSHAEIAETVGKTEASVRQIAHRAREHVQARRKRFAPARDTADAVAASFFRAATTGDVASLLDMLAPDVVMLSDGGGVVNTARRPVVGADHVARFVVGIVAKQPPGLAYEFASLNGVPAVVARRADGSVDTVVMVEADGETVTGLYMVRNPAKLATIDRRRDVQHGHA